MLRAWLPCDKMAGDVQSLPSGNARPESVDFAGISACATSTADATDKRVTLNINHDHSPPCISNAAACEGAARHGASAYGGACLCRHDSTVDEQMAASNAEVLAFLPPVICHMLSVETLLHAVQTLKVYPCDCILRMPQSADAVKKYLLFTFVALPICA